MKRLSVLAGAVVLASSISVQSAGAQTSAICTFSAKFIVTSGPGFSFTPMNAGGRFVTRDGRIDCQGVVEGKQVSGQGPLFFDGSYGVLPFGGTCFLDNGLGKFIYTIPTSGGQVKVKEPYTFTGGAAGDFVSRSYSGTFQIIPESAPAENNCTTTSVKVGRIIGQGVFVR